MNIKIVDSWLREFLDTKATAREIARQLSLKSVSVDRIEKAGVDFVYDIEITTNRADLMSVKAIAKETAVALSQEGITVKFNEPKPKDIQKSQVTFPIEIKGDPKLINRICAVVIEVKIGKAPKVMQDRLELSGIRSLNNLIDVTNYVMREIGHPAHVFDYDLLTTKKIIIRESKFGEKITTLDGKNYTLNGGDIVADDGSGKIIDLLGIMGTQNSVVNQNTKRILFFLDNNNPINIRRTSMDHGIRTEAAIINEKGIDPNLMTKTLEKGIELYEEIANGKVISEVFDWYPNILKTRLIRVSNEKVSKIIGVEIDTQESVEILEKLGFKVKKEEKFLEVEIPTYREDVQIDEDVIEEIARIYGYDKLDSIVPTFLGNRKTIFANNFYFEKRIKNALKYWGFSETYTNSLVSENLYEGPINEALKLKNPLSEEMIYLRNSLIPSLLQVLKINSSKENLKIFEMANIYVKKDNDLPNEILTLSGIIKQKDISFYTIKGIVEQILKDLGIKNLVFKKPQKGGVGAAVFTDKIYIGEIEVLDTNLVDFELNLETVLMHATLSKTFTPFAKFPPIVEDISIISDAPTQELVNAISRESSKIVDVTLKNQYQDTRTFHIVYQDYEKNLTDEDVAKIRRLVISELKDKLKAEVKE